MSLLTEIDTLDLKFLSDAIGEAVYSAIQDGKDEPNKVAQLTYRIPKAINQVTLSTKGYKLSAGGIFIHQRPYIVYNSNSCVELGDLLLISTVIDSQGIDRKAMLLQAKMINSLSDKPKNEDQHELYNKWPQFQYKAKALQAFNNGIRKIEGLDLHSSAKYLLLAKNHDLILGCPNFFNRYYLRHRYRCCALTAHPTNELSHHNCFTEELLQFVLGNKGKEFKDGKSLTKTEIGWSRVIDDLLKNVVDKTTRKMVVSGDNPKGKRGVDCLHFGQHLSFLYDFGNGISNWEPNDNEPPNDIPPWPENNEEDGGGVSVIEFVLRREESQETRS